MRSDDLRAYLYRADTEANEAEKAKYDELVKANEDQDVSTIPLAYEAPAGREVIAVDLDGQTFSITGWHLDGTEIVLELA